MEGYVTGSGGGGGGATIPSTTNLIKGDGAGNGADSLVSISGPTATRVKTVRDAADTLLELGGSYTPTGTWTGLTLVTPALGTPASGVITNCTGSPTLTAPALGTPASGTLTNCTGYPLGLVAVGLTASTTINDTVTYTTGGVTFSAPAIANNQVYRIYSCGDFVAVNSSTARNIQVAPFWGSTQLTAASQAVLTTSALTTSWQLQVTLQGTSTTAIWTTLSLIAHVNQASASTNTAILSTFNGTTTVSTGAQTLDLRFSMSSAVATDQWVVKQVLIERLA